MSTVSTSRTRGTAEKKAAAKDSKDQPAPRKNEALEWAKSIGAALLLFLVIRTFIVQAYSIPSNSMENTLLVGDYLMANNAIFGARLPLIDAPLPALRDPRRGEIVVFRPTYNNPQEDVVKRVIGIPGDTLQGRNGTVFVNGRQIREPYVQRRGIPDGEIAWDGRGGVPTEVIPERYGAHNHVPLLPAGVDRQSYRPTRDSWGPVVIPAGHYWMMGDNRDESLDSRFMGPIPRSVVRGKPLFIYFSVDKSRDAPFPRFLTAARWGRIGTGISSCCQN